MSPVPPALRGRLFRGSVVVAAGLLTRRQLQSRSYVRVAQDVYVEGQVPVDHRLRAVAVALTMPPYGYLTGASAGWFYGARTADTSDQVVVAVPMGTRWRTASVRLLRTPLPVRTREVCVDDLVHGADVWIRLATPTQAAVDALTHLPAINACVLVDALLSQGRTTVHDLRASLGRRAGLRAAHGLAALALCDGLAESPPETRLRVTLVQAGLPAPVPQHVVRTAAGGFVARVDLAWPELRVAVEYDGAWHGRPGQLGPDRRRLNALGAAGWTVVHVTAEMMNDPAGVVAEVVAALARAAA